ncbi:MAG TPA: DUF6092 family protein [Jatrophihabitans sp.]|jgi:hypothetical protein
MTKSVQSAVFSSVTSMVTAAPVMFDEPMLLHTFHMVDAAASLVGRLEGLGVTDEFLTEFHAEWEHGKVLMMSEPQTYITMLNDLAIKFVREAKKRNQSPSLEP